MVAQLLLHQERGVERPLRMVLVRGRSTEQRKDAITGGPRDIALVPMHRVNHNPQHRIDNRMRRLGVERLHQRRRTLQVGEERGYDLTLTGYFFFARRECTESSISCRS